MQRPMARDPPSEREYGLATGMNSLAASYGSQMIQLSPPCSHALGRAFRSINAAWHYLA
jgi:hypothetical protein